MEDKDQKHNEYQKLKRTNSTTIDQPRRERVAEWLRRLTRKSKVRTAEGSNPALDSLIAVRNSSPGRPEPCEGNLVAVAGSRSGLMVKHPWPLLEIISQTFAGCCCCSCPSGRSTPGDVMNLPSPSSSIFAG